MYRYSIKLDSTAREKLEMLLENRVTEKKLADRLKSFCCLTKARLLKKLQKNSPV